MKKITVTVMVCSVFLLGLVSGGQAGEKAPQKIIDAAHSTIVLLGEDPIIVDAVKSENAKGKTLVEVKEMDEKWKATPGIADYMRALMDSECGRHLREIQASTGYYSEIFVMDNLGGVVAMTDKTSDYWQGDEAKFTESFKDGQGAVFVDDVEFDESSQTYLVQVSIPVKDGEKVIGALTVGVDVDKF